MSDKGRADEREQAASLCYTAFTVTGLVNLV
jgi:hypothetical protein